MRLQHPEVRYEVTDHCNAECVMCPRDKHDRAHGVMDTRQFCESIDEVAALGALRVVLTGFGEPLLDRELEQKVAYANATGLKTYIITNASCLTRKRAEGLIRAGLDEMRVSFYGMSEKSYTAVMQGLEYRRTLDNIMGFLNLRQRTKVMLSFLCLPENEGEEDAFRQFWEPLVDYIEVWRPHNFGDGRDYRGRGGEKKSCGRPRNGPLQIQWDGTVIPCCYDYNNQIVLGDAFDTPVLEILEGEKYEALRLAHERGAFSEFPYCDQCDQLLERTDALVYTNRHSLPAEKAVQLSNTDLYDLVEAVDITER